MTKTMVWRWPITRKMFPFHDVIMETHYHLSSALILLLLHHHYNCHCCCLYVHHDVHCRYLVHTYYQFRNKYILESNVKVYKRAHFNWFTPWYFSNHCVSLRDWGCFSHDDVIKWKHFPCYWPLCGGFTGHRWIPRTKASDTELWCFLWSAHE